MMHSPYIQIQESYKSKKSYQSIKTCKTNTLIPIRETIIYDSANKLQNLYMGNTLTLYPLIHGLSKRWLLFKKFSKLLANR